MTTQSQAARLAAAHDSPAAHAARAPSRIVRASALTATPWKNGGGVTREIAAYPVGASLDTFVWRVSVADVERAGPFSKFPGIDRTLVLLAGAGMHLSEAHGVTHALMEPLSVARFDGEAALDAQLVDGATRDFNVMVRRERASATVQVWQGAGTHTLDADVALVFCARASLDVRVDVKSKGIGQGHATVPPAKAAATLAEMDTLVLDAPRSLVCEVTGDGAALAVLVHYA
ncbi:HutD/Ves family protein [Trinickia dinghuensis]|uniref:HutD family protein n=1 Tax=Trinickia dinghuensis TaxID=2291023 RepID=A0A3D8JXE2_9BURK|nr:HutD family protein [Trinickia dinghuensis]RDU97031.1 HutD family protein [Trinickia dinghuensis]